MPSPTQTADQIVAQLGTLLVAAQTAATANDSNLAAVSAAQTDLTAKQAAVTAAQAALTTANAAASSGSDGVQSALQAIEDFLTSQGFVPTPAPVAAVAAS